MRRLKGRSAFRPAERDQLMIICLKSGINKCLDRSLWVMIQNKKKGQLLAGPDRVF